MVDVYRAGSTFLCGFPCFPCFMRFRAGAWSDSPRQRQLLPTKNINECGRRLRRATLHLRPSRTLHRRSTYSPKTPRVRSVLPTSTIRSGNTTKCASRADGFSTPSIYPDYDCSRHVSSFCGSWMVRYRFSSAELVSKASILLSSIRSITRSDDPNPSRLTRPTARGSRQWRSCTCR